VSSWLPILMFTVLFGLSMDYEVFLLSRIREEWLASGDSRESVVRGLAATGRVITCAALIMVAVFSGFALDSDVTVKMMGVGMATAVAIDATLVRMVLVPATMALLGRANWWLPGWLDRVLPRVDVHGGAPVALGGPVSVVRPATVSPGAPDAAPVATASATDGDDEREMQPALG
jgi:RND superfamily putative drug exporter